MPINLTAITGAAQTGLTSPTYTPAVDTGPVINSKQWYISALGGTQTGVNAHSIASPFTVSFFRPAQFKVLKPVMPNSGALPSVPMNTHKVITRKGVLPLAGQPAKPMIITTIIETPAGADVADPNSVRAGLSAHIGALSQQSAGLGDTLVTGVL